MLLYPFPGTSVGTPAAPTNPMDFAGLRTWISPSNPANITSSGNITRAVNLVTPGTFDWVMPGSLNASTNGMPTATGAIQYPDVVANVMRTLPGSLTYFNRASDAARILRCDNAFSGTSDVGWTIATTVRASQVNATVLDRYLYRISAGGTDGGGVMKRVSNVPLDFFYAGVTYGQNSSGSAAAVGEDLWVPIIQSYTPPQGGNTSRHFFMVGGLFHPVGNNSNTMIDATPGSPNYGWPQTGQDYPARTDQEHLSIGGMRPVALTTHNASLMHQLDVMMWNRPLGIAEAQALTPVLWRMAYPQGVPPFLDVLHIIGDSLHQRGGGINCEGGYVWQNLSQVRRSACLFFNTAQGGNSIEVQEARTAATAGRMVRQPFHDRALAHIMLGTNNPTDDENQKLTKLLAVLSRLPTSIYNGVAIGTLLCTASSGTGPFVNNAGRNTAHAAFNTALATAVASGGSIATAYPGWDVGLLDYANVIPSGFTVAIKPFDPTTTTAINTRVQDTTPADTINGALYHMADTLHPRSGVNAAAYQSNAAPVLSAYGMYELQRDSVLRRLGLAVG